MTYVFIPYKLMKNNFFTTIIVKSWPMKFVMHWKKTKIQFVVQLSDVASLASIHDI
jgi:hypothetical protein